MKTEAAEKTVEKFQTPHEKAKTNPKPAKKKPTKKAAAPKASKARRGKLGELLGHSVVSVIRAFGKAGWDFDTAKAVLVKNGITPATHTLRVGLKRGAAGQKRIAPLSLKELNGLRAKLKKSSAA